MFHDLKNSVMMEEKNEQLGMRPVSDEELQQVSGGVDIVSNGECEKYRTQESCLSKQKCCWYTREKRCATSPQYL